MSAIARTPCPTSAKSALRRRLSDVAEYRNALLRLVATFADTDYHVGGRSTRAITFEPDLLEQARQVYRELAVVPLPDVSPTIHRPIEPTQWRGVPIPGVLPEVTLETVEHAIQACDPHDTQTLGELVEVRHTVATHDGLPNRFDGETIGGRLNPTGIVSPVTMSRRVRSLLLKDSGWVDYDLVGAHLSILRDLGKHGSLPTRAIERYLQHKDSAHQQWAAKIGHDDPEDFKQAILAFQNGARWRSG